MRRERTGSERQPATRCREAREAVAQKKLAHEERAKAEEAKAQADASAKLGAGAKGYAQRRKAAKEKEEQSKASVMIQAKFRGKKERADPAAEANVRRERHKNDPQVQAQAYMKTHKLMVRRLLVAITQAIDGGSLRTDAARPSATCARPHPRVSGRRVRGGTALRYRHRCHHHYRHRPERAAPPRARRSSSSCWASGWYGSSPRTRRRSS